MIDNITAKKAHDLIMAGNEGEAWPIVTDLVNKNPEDPKALYLAGWIMRQQGHVGVALQLLRRAAALKPEIPNIWMHYGACLHDTHSYEEAREAFGVVMKALPGDPMPMANIAASFVQQGKAKDAVEWADKALAIDGKHRIARIAKAFGCMALGRWADGWDHAEALYGEVITQRIYRDPPEPTWDGTKGQTVVVQADQGLGDMVMFAQCLPQMAQDCKEVILETSERMAGLFARSFPTVKVYPTLKWVENEWCKQHTIDAHIHISLLGRFYRKTDADFPKQAYLVPDEARRAKWRAWLKQFPKPWVGIAWRGGIIRTNEVDRSMELRELAPIIEQGGTIISLAYQDVAAEVNAWNATHSQQVQMPVIDNDGDYDETVALIAELDHVVTVTTTVAHVAGALGKRAYVIVNRHPAWRYCYGGDHLYWYPDSLTLYRQMPGEIGWQHVVQRVARDFEAFVLPISKAA